MKNKILLFFFSFFLTAQIFGQTGSRIGRHEPISSRTQWTIPRSSFASVEEGQQIIQDIIDVMGLTANFEIRAANIPNAAAVVSGGKRYVLYNPNFINSLVRTSGNKWSAISVLAHEVGHHLNGHTLSGSGSHPSIELEADEFSGFVLRKMGASLEDAQAAMRLIANQKASSTHPAQYDRLASIAKGWNTADRQITGKNDVAKTTPRQERPVQTTPSYPRQQQPTQQSPSAIETLLGILGQILFKGDQGSSSYVLTDALNVLKLVNNKYYQVGKLSKLNNSRYPYIITDRSNKRMYVDTRGNILNSNGQLVGRLTARR